MDVESPAASSKKGKSSMGPTTPPPPPPPLDKPRRRRRRNICLAVSAILFAILVLLLILGLVYFKAKQPVTTVNSVALKDLDFSLDIPKVALHLNLTLDVHVSVKNPNKVGFKYTNSTAFIKYRGQLVGEAPIQAGKISAGQTLPMNLTLTILADRLLSNSQLYLDVISTGKLSLATTTRVPGKVRILNIFNIHVVSYATCDVTVDVLQRKVVNQTCRYKAKL